MDNQNVKGKIYLTDFFCLTKSYDDILADHDLIKKMRATIEQAGMERYAIDCTFETLIKEAYFQCGIILRRSVCYDDWSYNKLFVARERRHFKKYDEINKKTVACMVHLLLYTRKRNPDGVGRIVDGILKDICSFRCNGFLPPNPFEELLYSGEYKHDIDFGVRAKPLDDFVWEDMNWYELGLEDDCDIYAIESGRDNPTYYCERLAKSIDEIMECLDLDGKSEQLKALDKIGTWLHDDIGCPYCECEFYNRRPDKCICEERFRALEPPYFNPLRQKVIEEKKQAIEEKFSKKTKTEVLPNIIIEDGICLSGIGNKIDMGRDNEKELIHNHIFQDRIFDTNERLTMLRSIVASAIDMGDVTPLYGKPQEVRINPNAKNEWYYIVKAIEESGVAKKFAITHFIEQMIEWFPILFPSSSKEEWERFKRLLSKSISEEKSLWKHGKMKDVVPLKDMWAKQKQIRMDSAKMERVYAIAYKGLYQNLVDLKDSIAKEKSR